MSTFDLAKLWDQRERSLRTGHVTWEEQEVHGTTMSSDRQTPQTKEVVTDTKGEFDWDGENMRYRSVGWIGAGDGKGLTPSDFKSVATTEGSKDLRVNVTGLYPLGEIQERNSLSSREDIQLLPVLMFVRPKDPRGAGIDLKSCELLHDIVKVEDRDCRVVRKVSGDRFDEWYVDPNRGFVICRYEVRLRAELGSRIDLSYQQAPDGTCVLSAWHSMFVSGGNLISDCKGTIKSVELNVPIVPEKFKLAFPPDTWVTDHLRNKSYLVRPDGSERILTKDELSNGATFEQLKNTDSGAALRRPYGWRPVVIMTLPAALIVAVIVRRLRRQ